MVSKQILENDDQFTRILYEKMQLINPGIAEMELYEFRYSLNNLWPSSNSWAEINPASQAEVESLVNTIEFYKNIKIKPRIDDRIVLDPMIVDLTQKMFVGIILDIYPPEWVIKHFYFDIRGFYFLHRTEYFSEKVKSHFGGIPFQRFEQRQKVFQHYQDIGYKQFKAANKEIDELFIEIVQKLIHKKGTPILLAIAGPTAAGKTEIVERLHQTFLKSGKKTTSLELDNFLTDRDYREEKGIHTLGRIALHFDLLKRSLKEIMNGESISIPRYDFVFATSSHDIDGNLKPDGKPIIVEPADIVFMEGNSPFLFEEIAQLVGIKVVYLTDDEIRLKRKWKRDIDYRKKYEPSYFRNRFFKDQFIMAHEAYRPQLELCDIAVDTTNATLWLTPEIKRLLLN